jgi:Flp pilus assembly pilin Flp
MYLFKISICCINATYPSIFFLLLGFLKLKRYAMEAIRKTLRDSAPMRWLMLVLISMLMLSTYWFQDFFGGLKGLMESEMGFTSEEYGRLIGLTTIANMFGMIILGGSLGTAALLMGKRLGSIFRA